MYNILQYLNLDFKSITEIIIVLIVALALNCTIKRYLKNLEKEAIQENNKWHKVIIKSIITPVQLFIATQICYIITKSIVTEYINVINTFRTVLIIICIALFTFKIINEIEKYVKESIAENKNYNEITTVKGLIKLSKIIVIVTISIIILDNIGIKTKGLVIVASISSAAIGFASKNIVANFFGTIMIYLDKPFVENDWISSPDKNIEGIVEEIGWRVTRVRTLDRKPLYIPNDTFSNICIQNNSRMNNRRIKKILTLRYKDIKFIKEICYEITMMMSKHNGVAQSLPKYVQLTNFSDHSVDIILSCFTKEKQLMEFYKTQQCILIKVAEIIKKNGADFASPTINVHYENN